MLSALNEVIPVFKDRKDLIIVVVFAVVVGIIRLPYLGYLSFWWDEGAQVLAAEGILRHGYPILPSGEVYRHSPLCSYLIAFSFMVFGSSEFSARIVSLIFSSSTLPFVYLLGKDLGNKRAGAIGTVIVAFSPWAVTWARQARMYAQFQFFSFLTIYIFYKTYVSEGSPHISLKNNVFLFASFVCTMLSHELALTIIPSLLACFLIIGGFRWIRNRNFVIGAIILGVLCLVFFLFAIGTTVPPFKLSWLRHNLLRSYKPFQTRYPVLLLFVIMGASVLLMRKDKNLLYLYINFLVPLHLVPIMVAGLGASSGLTIEVFDRYLFFLLPIFALAGSFSLLQHVDSVLETVVKKLGDIASRLNKDRFKNVTTWIVLLMVIFPVVSNLYVRVFVPDSHISLTEAFSHYQPKHYSPWIDIDIEYGGVRGACEFIEKYYQDGDAIISTSTRSYPLEHLPVYYYLQGIISEESVSLFYLMLKVGQTKDAYLNCTIINTLNELEEIMYYHKHGWIIITERLISLYASNEVVGFILENTELVYENEEEHTNVYVWS